MEMLKLFKSGLIPQKLNLLGGIPATDFDFRHNIDFVKSLMIDGAISWQKWKLSTQANP